MAKYEPFDKTKRKIQTTFEKVQSNSNEINNQNIKKLEVRFRSENHFKPITIIPVVTDYLLQSTSEHLSISLLDFPDWAINMVKPSIVFSLPSPFHPQNEIENFQEAEFGEFSIPRWQNFYWFTKFEGGYKFTFRSNAFYYLKSASPVTQPSLFFVNISLHILNERNYNKIQSGK